MQRVSRARVDIANELGVVETVGAIEDLAYVVGKLVALRVFEDDRGKMSLALSDVGGKLLFITQFTLYGDVRRGNRPSFVGAMPPGEAEPFLERAVALARARVPVETGRFGADMRVVVENDGPVTILIDSRG